MNITIIFWVKGKFVLLPIADTYLLLLLLLIEQTLLSKVMYIFWENREHLGVKGLAHGPRGEITLMTHGVQLVTL